MDFSLNESQEMLKESARGFLENECPKEWVKKMEQDVKGYSPDMWSKMAKMGWMGIAFPEKYGGTGGNFLDLVVLFEEMGRAALPGPFLSTVVLGGFTLLQTGTEQQKTKLLPLIAAGNAICTLALTEPSGKYTADGIAVRADVKRNGYEIDGTKLFIPDAHISDFIICVARTKNTKIPENGITLFIVDGKTSDLSCTVLPTISGDKQCEIVFNKKSVPKENMLGGLNQGWPQVEQVLQKASVAKCAEMVGAAQQVLEMTIDYVKNRAQYGRVIGSFQAIRHHCANIAIDVETCRWITYQAAWMLSEGLPAGKQVAMAKAFVSQAFRKLTSLADQCHGTISMTADHDMPLYFKRAKAWQLILGNPDFHIETVAREAGFVSQS